MKTILVTGATGYLGSNITRHFCTTEKYGVIKVARINQQDMLGVDLVDEASVERFARSCNPEIIIHAAGKKAHACERDPEAASINILSSQHLIRHFPSSQIYFISSDFVFDGTRGNYKETDLPNPLTRYGKSKLEAERAYDLQQHCVIRTAGLFGINSQGFLQTVFSHNYQENPLEAFTDVYNTPTYTTEFCKYLEMMVDEGITGLFHVAGPNRLSRFQFANLVARVYQFDNDLIHGIKAPDTFLSPRDSSLDSSRVQHTLGVKMKSTMQSLEEMHAKEIS
ncbi:SDR family oxidoreductase [Candidatus Woesearchaeota archaeon]|nr:SDR family oxidoreductase [Candidatus Woesearchaeota archaeon]